MPPARQANHIVLIGGGHAHVAVLADWIKDGLPCERATLLTPHRTLRYSGTVPGWISGQYDHDDGLVDVAALAEKAGVELVLGRCLRIDADIGSIRTEAGDELAFDISSIDTGGVGRAADILGEDPRILDIRPIDRFVDCLEEMADRQKIAVVGGGAGGVELAFALRNRKAVAKPPEIVLITGADGLLESFSRGVSDKVRDELARQDIELCAADARIEGGQLKADGHTFEVDSIIAAIGSGAPSWPRESGLAVDEDGFIAVDEHQRSISHTNIFAVGDIASRQDRDVPHSGVHAVMAGPVLANNLRAACAGPPPSKTYRPRLYSLYLLSTARGEAIASYGPLAAQGRWVARLKHWFDTRWISKYAQLGGKL